MVEVEIYETLDATMLEFIDVIITFAPVTLEPLRRQLKNAQSCNASNGWLYVIDVSNDAPIDWHAGPPGLELFDYYRYLHESSVPELGPNGCYSIALNFHPDGRLNAFDFLNLHEGPMDIPATTRWLQKTRPSEQDIHDGETWRRANLQIEKAKN